MIPVMRGCATGECLFYWLEDGIHLTLYRDWLEHTNTPLEKGEEVKYGGGFIEMSVDSIAKRWPRQDSEIKTMGGKDA